MRTWNWLLVACMACGSTSDPDSDDSVADTAESSGDDSAADGTDTGDADVGDTGSGGALELVEPSFENAGAGWTAEPIEGTGSFEVVDEATAPDGDSVAAVKASSDSGFGITTVLSDVIGAIQTPQTLTLCATAEVQSAGPDASGEFVVSLKIGDRDSRYARVTFEPDDTTEDTRCTDYSPPRDFDGEPVRAQLRMTQTNTNGESWTIHVDDLTLTIE